MTVRKPDSICQDLVGSGSDNLKRCECCESSRYFSGAVNTCPRTDLSIIALDVYFKGAVNNVPQVDIDCAPLLNSDKCTEEFGMKLGSGTEFYNLLSLPPGVPGTQAISDVGAFTTFPGPQTMTLEMFGGYSSVITMAPWTAGSGGSGVRTGDVAAAATGSSSASGSGGKPSAVSMSVRGAVAVAVMVASLVTTLWT